MKGRTVDIIAIGNELLSGRTLDTNTSYIARKLFDVGVLLGRVSVVGDSVPEIVETLTEATNRSPLVITTGGLGPTTDDLTRQAIAEFCRVPLEMDHEALTKLEELSRKRRRPLNENNKRQAYFPRGADRIVNSSGTADAFLVTTENNDGAPVRILSLPGVPREVNFLFEHVLVERVQQLFSEIKPPTVATLKLFGLSEAYIGSVIEQLGISPDIEIGYRPQFPVITISLLNRGPGGSEPVAATAEICAEAIGKEFIFGRNEHDALAAVVGALLRDQKKTLAAAESCTGGIFASEIVSVPGASEYFLGSVVTYSNQAKEKFVDVAHETLFANGAVSEDVVKEMALGARLRFGADIAIATTGIAGPNGGTTEKPIGTVWFGISTVDETIAVHVFAPWERNAFRRYCAYMALDLVRRHLLNLPLSWERK